MTREEAIKILNNYDLNFCDIDGNPIPPQDLAEACDMAIEALEQDKPKWIPVSERLPEEGDVVLICSKIGAIDFGKRKGDKWVWLAEALWDYWQETEDLIAWMPLPDAYREDEQ